MKIKNILPITVVLSTFALTGCGETTQTEQNTTMVQDSTSIPIGNNINGVFDGNQYDWTEITTYDTNYNSGYKKTDMTNMIDMTNTTTTNTTNSRFGKGMKGAENIKGNEEKSVTQKIYSDVDKAYENIKEKVKS